MFKRNFLFTTGFIIISLFATSQDFAKQFKDLLSEKDTTATLTLLKNWETAKPKDPELFIAYFNFYVRQSKKEIVSLTPDKKNQPAFEVTDSTGKAVGYLSSTMNYNPVILKKGFDYIDRGISLYPSRLDMRFGKVYMLGEAESFQEFTRVIVETIDYGNKINHAWLWKEGKPLEDATKFFLSSMQDYVTTLYNTEDDKLLPLMRQISEAVLKYFPKHVESLDNVALTYLLTGDNDNALKYLLKAEEAAPKDVIVLFNLAEVYKRKGDKAKAKSYYEKVIKFGTDEEKKDAKEKLKEL